MSCLSEKPWFVYIIRCRDLSLYTGITTDVPRRFAEHASAGPKSARYLRGRGPLALVFSEYVGTHAHALRVEHWLKQQPKKIKEAIIAKELMLPERTARP